MGDAAENAVSEGEGIEAGIDTVIAAFDGDIRAAIRSLIFANWLGSEVDRLKASQSAGYVRGRYKKV